MKIVQISRQYYHGLGGLEVLGQVPGIVPPDDRKMRARFEHFGPDDELLQRVNIAALFAQGEARKGAVAHGGVEAGGEIFVGSGRHQDS